MLIILTMILIGVLLGFVGAGGSGFIIAILTAFFGVPIHTALGTSLAAMVFTSLSGTYSHYREDNVVIRIGLAVGAFGAVGAFMGSRIAYFIPGHDLSFLTAGMLFFSGVLVWFRIFTRYGKTMMKPHMKIEFKGIRFWLTACVVGIITGMISGVFGIGGAMFIQLGLLIFFGLPLQKAVGTTMLIILPTAMVGGIGYYTVGYLDVLLLIKVASGVIIGTYMGAKFTNRLPAIILKTAVVIVPIIGGFILLFG